MQDGTAETDSPARPRITRPGAIVNALLLAAATLVGAADRALAAGPEPEAAASAAPRPAPASVYDRIWGLARLYSNPDNRWIQELSVVGRQQVDWYVFEKDKGHADDFVNRRTRIGLKARVFQTVTLHSEVDLNLEGEGEVYTRLTDAYVKWSPDKRANVTVGKHGAKFTLDGGTSSTSLITIDRSNIANNFWFPEEYVPGVSVNGEVGKWSYNAGYFSSGDADSEFGDFSAGSFLLLSGGYDFAAIAGADKGLLRADYVRQEPNAKNDFTRSHEHVGSINFQLEKGRWGLGTDFDMSDGSRGQPDLIGGQVMPSVKLMETWQLVLRYTGISSDGDNGIRFARYENAFVAGQGDEYDEIYIGVNKYFYGHKLKLQVGGQYSSMHDAADDGGRHEGWGLTIGLRTFW